MFLAYWVIKQAKRQIQVDRMSINIKYHEYIFTKVCIMGNGQINNPQLIEKQLYSCNHDQQSSNAQNCQDQRQSSIYFDLQKQLNYSLEPYHQKEQNQKQEIKREKNSLDELNLYQKDQFPILKLQQAMLKQETPHQIPEIFNNQVHIPAQQTLEITEVKPQVMQPLGPKTYIKKFAENKKGNTIILQEDNSVATQKGFYFQNEKLILTDQISSKNSEVCFRSDNLKYCVGFGIALKEVIEKHNYNYKCHGLYIVTSQGFSWSHSEKDEDDQLRDGFNQLYSGAKVTVWLEGQALKFKFKKKEFQLKIRSEIVKKYTVCFCAYLHEKQDSVSIVEG